MSDVLEIDIPEGYTRIGGKVSNHGEAWFRISRSDVKADIGSVPEKDDNDVELCLIKFASVASIDVYIGMLKKIKKSVLAKNSLVWQVAIELDERL